MAAAPRRRSVWLHPVAKPLLFAVSLLPFVWLFYAAATDQLGANPQEHLIRSLGDWTLRFLCLTLAVTPLRVLASQPALARFRRMLGLFAYFYACLHLVSLRLVRHGPGLRRDRCRHRQAAVHPGRLHRLPAADTAGGDLVQPGDPRAWRVPLAGVCTAPCTWSRGW